jgi:hypothetical protein
VIAQRLQNDFKAHWNGSRSRELAIARRLKGIVIVRRLRTDCNGIDSEMK